MNVENALYPTPDRIAALMTNASGEPVVMFNLLKFRDEAAYPDGRSSDLSGREAYMLYGVPMQQLVAREGGRMIFSGQVQSLVIGTVDDMWDVAALMEYPSSAAFARIATSPEVAAIGQGVCVVRPDLSHEYVAMPDPFTTNLCFTGPDRRTALVTLSGGGRLVALDWPRPGLRLKHT